MKNILLVGDSIRIGYDKSVKKSLEGIANVYYPNENCRFASYVLRYLHEYKALIKDGEVDVLHFNTGLWDNLHLFDEEAHTPIDVYGYYMERICVRIKKLFPNAKVIFATSTSVSPQSEYIDDYFKRYNKEIEAYNKVAVDIVKRYGFEINDLYSLSTTLPESAHSDSVHYYTKIGTKAFTNQVLQYLCKALNIEQVEYVEEMYQDKPIGV